MRSSHCSGRHCWPEEKSEQDGIMNEAIIKQGTVHQRGRNNPAEGIKYATHPVRDVTQKWPYLSWKDARYGGGSSRVTGRVGERSTGSQDGSLFLGCHNLLSGCGANTGMTH